MLKGGNHIYRDETELRYAKNTQTTMIAKAGQWKSTQNIHGLVQACSISSVLAMEILQSCTTP